MNRAIKRLSVLAAAALTAGFAIFAAASGTGWAGLSAQTVFAASEFTYAEQVSGSKVTYLMMKPGEQTDLCFKGVKNHTKYTYRWTSSNEAVAKVDKMGVVTALADGSAQITLTVGDGTEYTSEPVSVMVSSMTLTAGTSADHALAMAELDVGGTVDLNFYGIRDWNSRKGSYLTEWDSSNPSVAKVSQKDGTVTGVSKGTAVVIFRIYDMEKDILLNSAPVTITVK